MQNLSLPPALMQYPLREKIGAPALFVGREQEFKDFSHYYTLRPFAA